MQVLRQPYVLATVSAVLTAVIVYFYTKTTDREPAPRHAFFKTLAAGLAVGIALTWFTTSRGAAVSVAPEPFFTDPTVNFPSAL
jgi:hypothetical protein